MIRRVGGGICDRPGGLGGPAANAELDIVAEEAAEGGQFEILHHAAVWDEDIIEAGAEVIWRGGAEVIGAAGHTQVVSAGCRVAGDLVGADRDGGFQRQPAARFCYAALHQGMRR